MDDARSRVSARRAFTDAAVHATPYRPERTSSRVTGQQALRCADSGRSSNRRPARASATTTDSAVSRHATPCIGAHLRSVTSTAYETRVYRAHDVRQAVQRHRPKRRRTLTCWRTPGCSVQSASDSPLIAVSPTSLRSLSINVVRLRFRSLATCRLFAPVLARDAGIRSRSSFDTTSVNLRPSSGMVRCEIAHSVHIIHPDSGRVGSVHHRRRSLPTLGALRRSRPARRSGANASSVHPVRTKNASMSAWKAIRRSRLEKPYVRVRPFSSTVSRQRTLPSGTRRMVHRSDLRRNVHSPSHSASSTWAFDIQIDIGRNAPKLIIAGSALPLCELGLGSREAPE